MADPSELRQELADANRHIVEGNARTTRQAEAVRKLDADGHDTTDAENLLRLMKEALEARHAHRKQIVRELSCAPDEQC